MTTQDLFRSIENIDSELLYDARAYRAPKLSVIRRTAIAAAVVITLLASVLIYANFIYPASSVSLCSKDNVTLTVNLRGNVINVLSDHKAYRQTAGRSISAAVEEITALMIQNGALDENENTLLISADDSLKEVLKSVESVFAKERFNGCTVRIKTKETDNQSELSPAKVSLIDLLTENSESLSFDSLKELSVNDLHLLLREMKIKDNNLIISGKPSENLYIGKERAKNLAMEKTSLASMEDISVSYSVYHRKLIYLVTLHSGDSAEAYFINARNGEPEHTITAGITELSRAVQNEIKSGNTPSSQNEEPESNNSYTPQQTVSEVTDDEQDITAETSSPAQSVPQAPTEPEESADYAETAISMMELSFVTMTPPSSAKEVSYNTLFEGQFIEDRTGEKKNGGSITLITNYSQLTAYPGPRPRDSPPGPARRGSG